MPTSSQGSEKKAGILLVLLFSLVLHGVGIWYGLPGQESWAPDEILPRDVQDGIARRFSHDWCQKYPPLHYYQLALVETPFLIFAKVRGLDYDDLSFYSLLILAGRFLSLFMGAGIILLVYKCGREIFDERSSLLAAWITALLVPLVYHAKMANVDVPYLFWFMASLLCFLRLLKTHRRKYYLLFALTAILSVCTKDQAFALYVLPVIWMLLADWKSRKKADPNLTMIRFLGQRTYLYAAAVAVMTFALAQNLVFNIQGFLLHLKVITRARSFGLLWFPNTIAGNISLLELTLSQIRFSFGWPLFAIGTIGLVKALAARSKNFLELSLLAFPASYLLFYIFVIRYNFARFNLPICFILCFFGGQFLASAWKVQTKYSKFFRMAAAAALLYSVFYAASLDVYMVKDSRYAVEKWIKRNIPQGTTIGGAVWWTYAPRLPGYRRVPLELFWPSFQKLDPKPDYVLVNKDFSRLFWLNPRRREFFENFYRGEERYRVVLQYRTPLSWLPLRQTELAANINLINPEILIYKKVTRPPKSGLLD
jgi:4-amino-4-deoxy-L-arabinose transferase-like glycosyltransferase